MTRRVTEVKLHWAAALLLAVVFAAAAVGMIALVLEAGAQP